MQNWRENNPYLFFAMLKKQLPYLERELLYETDKIATEAVAVATLAMMIATKSSVEGLFSPRSTSLAVTRVNVYAVSVKGLQRKIEGEC